MILLTACGSPGADGLSAEVQNQVDQSETPTPTPDDPGTSPTSPPAAAHDFSAQCHIDVDSDGPNTQWVRMEICRLVNVARAEAGLPPLTLEVQRTQVAQAHAKDMYVNGYFSHTNLSGQSSFDRLRAAGITFGSSGENIAKGAGSAQEIMNLWMNSEGHRANILRSSYKRLGVGNYKTRWVQVFTD